MQRRHGSTSAHASCGTPTNDLRVTFVARAPGRVNLIGEHTDYNEGFVLPIAIDRSISIAFEPTDDLRVEITLASTGEVGGFDLDAIGPRTGTWIDYVAGTAWSMAEAGLPVRGFRGVLESDLPQGSGLASSAALELASALALSGGERAAGRSDDARSDRSARRERVRGRVVRSDGSVRLGVRSGWRGVDARLPIAGASRRTARPGRCGAWW